MDEIKPIAWVCNAHVFFSEQVADDYSQLCGYEVLPVVTQSAIDTLQAEVERLGAVIKSMREAISAGVMDSTGRIYFESGYKVINLIRAGMKEQG